MSDLLERLKKVESSVPLGPGDTRQTTNWFRNPDGPEAAAELTRLTAENARLRDVMGVALQHLRDDLQECAQIVLEVALENANDR